MNNKNKIVFITILILNILGISLIYGQNQGTSSVQFLKIIPSAKIMSMGEAGSAITNNAEAAFLNPAGLAYVKNLDVSFFTVDWILDTKINAASVAYALGTIGTIGLNFINVDYGSFEETTVENLGFVGSEYNPGLTGRTFTAGATLIGLSYARSLTTYFSFGITANYIEEDLFLEKMKTTTFNFGMTYYSDFKSLKLGIALRNMGPKVVYVEEENTIPQTIIIGFSGFLISNDESLITTSENHTVSFAVDLIQARDDISHYHLGFDYGINNLLHLRAGYKLDYDSEGLTLGFGVAFKFANLDYSFNDLGDYWEPAHRFTIGLSF